MSGNIIAVKRKVLFENESTPTNETGSRPDQNLTPNLTANLTSSRSKKESKSVQTDDQANIGTIDYDLLTTRIITAMEAKLVSLFSTNIYSKIIDCSPSPSPADADVAPSSPEESEPVPEEPGMAAALPVVADLEPAAAVPGTEAVPLEPVENAVSGTEAVSLEPEKEEPPKPVEPAAKMYNDYFQATMILDLTCTGTGVAEANHLNIENCFLISPDLPDDCTPSKRILYYLHSAIEIAKEHQYSRINIIANHLRIYKNFMDVMMIAIPLLKSTDWELVHYCCNNVSYPHQHLDLDNFNWTTYCTINNDLPDIIKSTKPRAIQDWCARGNKLGRFAEVSLLESTSNNTLAFGVNSSEYDKILTTLEHMMLSPNEGPLFDNITKKFMLAPNMFMVPGTGASIMKQLRWLPQLYLEV